MKQVREARDRFAALLQKPNTKEDVWQKLFTECPYILSRALPLRLSPRDICPLARPGRSEPDFIFFPHRPTKLPTFGVIELKRPSSKIIVTPRKEIITLSRDANTAIRQAYVYWQKFKKSPIEREETLFLGNSFFVFVIMGMSIELAPKLCSDLVRQQLSSLLPEQCRIVPYDTLYRQFEQSVPPRVLCLVPALKRGEIQPDNRKTTDVIAESGQQGPLLVTDREKEVAQLVAKGFTNSDIGEKLSIGQVVVRDYLLRIFEKLELSSRLELALHAIHHGWVDEA